MWVEIKSVVTALFASGLYMQVLLFVAGMLLLWTLRRSHANNHLNLHDILVGPDGKTSGTKIARLGAFLVSTWGFVYLVIDKNLSEWYYGLYMITWASAPLANKWLNSRSSANTETKS